jgi:hypothetical protein
MKTRREQGSPSATRADAKLASIRILVSFSSRRSEQEHHWLRTSPVYRFLKLFFEDVTGPCQFTCRFRAPAAAAVRNDLFALTISQECVFR